jgi:hypothetical protein
MRIVVMRDCLDFRHCYDDQPIHSLPTICFVSRVLVVSVFFSVICDPSSSVNVFIVVLPNETAEVVDCERRRGVWIGEWAGLGVRVRRECMDLRELIFFIM